MVNNILGVVTTVVSAIAAISLLVGAIGSGSVLVGLAMLWLAAGAQAQRASEAVLAREQFRAGVAAARALGIIGTSAQGGAPSITDPGAGAPSPGVTSWSSRWATRAAGRC